MESPRAYNAKTLSSKAVEPTLTLSDQLGLETAVAVAGQGNVELCRLRLDCLLALTVTAILATPPVPRVGRIPEVCRQLSLQGTLDEPLGQLSEQARLAKDILGIGIVFEEFI